MYEDLEKLNFVAKNPDIAQVYAALYSVHAGFSHETSWSLKFRRLREKNAPRADQTRTYLKITTYTKRPRREKILISTTKKEKGEKLIEQRQNGTKSRWESEGFNHVEDWLSIFSVILNNFYR